MCTTSRCSRAFFVYFILSLMCLGHNSGMLYRSRRFQSELESDCRLIPFKKEHSIPDCLKFNLVTNVCVGFCRSFSFPTKMKIFMDSNHSITTESECCNMMETENIKVKVQCVGGSRDFIFKSALSCSCYHCKKSL